MVMLHTTSKFGSQRRFSARAFSKSLILAALIFLTYSDILGQNNYHKGTELKFKDEISEHQVTPLSDGNYLSIVKTFNLFPDLPSIEYANVIDSKGKIVRKVNWGKMASKTFVKDLLKNGDKIYLIERFIDRKMDVYYAVEFDLGSMRKVGDRKKIYQHDNSKDTQGRKLDFYAAENGAGVVVVERSWNLYKPVTDGCVVALFDPQFEQLAKTSLNAEDIHGEPFINSQGTAYAMFLENGLKKNEKKSLKLVSLSSGQTVETLSIDHRFEPDRNGVLLFDEEGYCNLAGTAKVDGLAAGMYQIRIDLANFEIVYVNVTPYSREFLRTIVNKKDREAIERSAKSGKDEVKLSGFSILNILKTSAGQIYVLAEQNRNGFSSKDFVFGDLIVLRFNETGQVEWVTTLPKRQKHNIQMDRFIPIAGCTAHVKGESIHVIYNTDPDNIGNPPPEDVTVSKGLIKSTICVAKIQPSGEVSLSPLDRAKQADFNLNFPNTCVDEENDMLFVVFATYKSTRYGTIILEE